jgi:hypothetical protein
MVIEMEEEEHRGAQRNTEVHRGKYWKTNKSSSVPLCVSLSVLSVFLLNDRSYYGF